MEQYNNQNQNARIPQIGDVYFVKFEGNGSEQQGIRPALVFQNNVGNAHSPNVVVFPLTSSLKKLNLPTHVFLPAKETGLIKDSMVLCENPVCISRSKLGRFITSIPDDYMSKVAEANLLASSAISYLDYNALFFIWQKAIALNSKA